MPLIALPKIFKPVVAPAHGRQDSQCASKWVMTEPQPQDDSDSTDTLGISRSEEWSSSGDESTPQALSENLLNATTNKFSTLSGKLFRTIRTSLSRKSSIQSMKERKSITKRNPVEDQMEIAKRINYHLTEVFAGTIEPNPMFVGDKEPPISFTNYVHRLIELTNKWVEESDGRDSFGVRCAVLAVDYLERIDVRLDSRSIHRYYMAAFLIGIKLLYDYYISNSFWAEVAGCPRKQVNQMESQLCKDLRWDFTVDAEQHAVSISRFTR